MPFIVGIGEDSANEAKDSGFVGKILTTRLLDSRNAVTEPCGGETTGARLPSDEAMASRSEARLLYGAGDATGNGDRIPTRDRPAVEYPVRGV